MIDRPQQPAQEVGGYILLLTVEKGRDFANRPWPCASTGRPAGPCHTPRASGGPDEEGALGWGKLACCHLAAVSDLTLYLAWSVTELGTSPHLS